MLRLAQEAGLVKLGRIAIDASKLKVNASKHKAMSYGHMCAEIEKLEGKIREILSRAEAIDEAEDAGLWRLRRLFALSHRQTRLEARAKEGGGERRVPARSRSEGTRRERRETQAIPHRLLWRRT